MADKYSRAQLIEMLDQPGWRTATGSEAFPFAGTLREMVEAAHERHITGRAAGYLQQIETAIEVDMPQLEELWYHLGLPL